MGTENECRKMEKYLLKNWNTPYGIQQGTPVDNAIRLLEDYRIQIEGRKEGGGE